MDEMTLVRELRQDAPTVGPPVAVRQRFLEAALPRPSRHRTGWRVAAGAAVTAAAATVLVVAVQVGPGATPGVTAVLDTAADTVAAAPVAEPRGDQWVYQSFQQAGPAGQAPTQLGEGWTRFDGTRFADHAAGSERLEVQPVVAGSALSPQQWYDDLSALPRDPQELLARLRRGDFVRGHGATRATRDFDAVTRCLSAPGVLPATAHARLFRALAAIPGVGIDRHPADDLVGRPVLSVTFSGETEQGSSVRNRHELLLDPTTYAYRGERVTALEDGTLNGKERVAKGQVWYDGALVDTAIVDRPGQLP